MCVQCRITLALPAKPVGATFGTKGVTSGFVRVYAQVIPNFETNPYVFVSLMREHPLPAQQLL